MLMRERADVVRTDVDPVRCPRCGQRGVVADSRHLAGYRRRRHACACGQRWTTYQSVVNPRRLEPTEYDEQLFDYVEDLARQTRTSTHYTPSAWTSPQARAAVYSR